MKRCCLKTPEGYLKDVLLFWQYPPGPQDDPNHLIEKNIMSGENICYPFPKLLLCVWVKTKQNAAKLWFEKILKQQTTWDFQKEWLFIIFEKKMLWLPRIYTNTWKAQTRVKSESTWKIIHKKRRFNLYLYPSNLNKWCPWARSLEEEEEELDGQSRLY